MCRLPWAVCRFPSKMSSTSKGIRAVVPQRFLQGYIAPYDATVIAKLRAAGAIPFGRVNMDEFAMGSSTENSAFGPTQKSVGHYAHSRRFERGLGRCGSRR